METYKIEDVHAFSKVKESWGIFSNMSNTNGAIKVNGMILKNTEALYQASRYPEHPEFQKEIIAQTSGFASKLISKKYMKAYTRSDWDEVRVDIMKYCVALKVYQNPAVRKLLAVSADKPIVEKSHKDKFWGAVQYDNELIGENVLGKILMEIRENLDAYKIRPDHNIPNFMLLGHDIEKSVAKGSDLLVF